MEGTQVYPCDTCGGMRAANSMSRCTTCGSLLHTWRPTEEGPPGTHPCPICRRHRAVSTTGRCSTCGTPIAESTPLDASAYASAQRRPLWAALVLLALIAAVAPFLKDMGALGGGTLALLMMGPASLIVYYVRSQV